MAGNGRKHRTAWAGPGDGVLVRDQKNEIDFTSWDVTAKTDLEALKNIFDTDQDGALDSDDADWSPWAEPARPKAALEGHHALGPSTRRGAPVVRLRAQKYGIQSLLLLLLLSATTVHNPMSTTTGGCGWHASSI